MNELTPPPFSRPADPSLGDTAHEPRPADENVTPHTGEPVESAEVTELRRQLAEANERNALVVDDEVYEAELIEDPDPTNTVDTPALNEAGEPVPTGTKIFARR